MQVHVRDNDLKDLKTLQTLLSFPLVLMKFGVVKI